VGVLNLRSSVALGIAAVVLAWPASGVAGAPPGATARCLDGTYSFSQTHSGTCSHHGGVAQWLDASSGSAATTTTAGSVNVGRTVLLARRTRKTGCGLGANPDRRCSPGAYYSRLTKAVICSSSFRTGPIRNVPESEKFQVEREYGMAPGHYGRALEIDHIVSLELGGSNDIANLFPERAYAHPGYRVKDKLENELHRRVCAGTMSLRAVQRAIASNWQALYRRVFGTDPLGAPSPTATVPTTTTVSTTTTAPPPPTTTTTPPATTTTSRGNCDPSYPTVCIQPRPPDLNCKDVPYTNFKVLPPDPHGFDGDHDGIGCET
jgi:hypothetical protein